MAFSFITQYFHLMFFVYFLIRSQLNVFFILENIDTEFEAAQKQPQVGRPPICNLTVSIRNTIFYFIFS